MTEAEWRNDDDPKLRSIFKYYLRDHVKYQDGRHSEAPALLFADYDYEVGDGTWAVSEDGKRCNEPAIVYVRADSLLDAIARAEKAEAERDAEWNNAIRAAIVRLGVLIDRPGAKADRELVRGIRELLREGVAMRCAECDCENGGADCNWIASGDKEGGAA